MSVEHSRVYIQPEHFYSVWHTEELPRNDGMNGFSVNTRSEREIKCVRLGAPGPSGT